MYELQRHSAQFKAKSGDHRTAATATTAAKIRQKQYSRQRSILKSSHDTNTEDQEVLEAKKQLILRRRRLFSHYRQYEQWRRQQFSYDPCYFRANPLPIGQAACGDYYSNIGIGTGAYRRRRQYQRQYSCADRSHDGSRDSRDSTMLRKCHSMATGDALHTDSAMLKRNKARDAHYPYEHVSFDSSELHRCNSRNFNMLNVERSASIAERCTRSRINSAIFVSSEGRGFDSIEFLRRHGSQSVLCRKAQSAENITNNERKKSFSEQRHWRTNVDPQRRKSVAAQRTAGDFEMKECRPSTETRVLSVLSSNAEQSTSAASPGNIVVGSISIEAPPSNIYDDTNSDKSDNAAPITRTVIASINSASHDSADTVEELIQITTTTTTPAPNASETPATSPSPSASPTPLISPSTSITIKAPTIALTAADRRSRTLVRQRSSNISPISLRQGFSATNQSKAHPTNPKKLHLKGVKPKAINNLPMVSISGPSPQEEKPEGL